jgi:hypothetical protein
LPSTNIAKWLGTLVLVIGAAVNGLGIYPAGPIIMVLGGIIWLAVAIRIRDSALATTNAVMTLVTAIAIVIHYL